MLPPFAHAPESGSHGDGRFSGRAGYALRRVQTREDWAQVRSLRWAALSNRGDVATDRWNEHADRHDAALNATTFLLAREGRPLGSTRTSVRSAPRAWPVPAMDAFASEIERAVGPQATVVEASLTVVEPRTVDPSGALFRLFKAQMLACALENADWLICAVRESRMGFFRRMFNMEILSGAETLPGLAFPRVLMGLRFREHAGLLFKRIPVLAVDEDDERHFEATGVVRFEAQRALAAPASQPVAARPED